VGALLAASCSLPWTSSGNQGALIPEIAIASDLPLSGTLGVGATPLSDAIALAIHDQRTIGGFRLTYVPLDDAFIGTFSADKTEQNVRLMINDSRVLAFVGPYSSGAARIAIPLANKTNLVMISPSNTADCLTSATDPCPLRPTPLNNYFRTAASDSAQASAAARLAVQTLGLTRFAVLDGETDYDKNLADVFASALIASGGAVALRSSYSPYADDYTELLHEARVAKAEAVYVGNPSSTAACRLRAQMASVFPTSAYMIGGDGLAGCGSDAGAGADEHLLAMVSDPQPATDSKVYKEFRAHHIPPVPYAFGAYDCAQIIIDALGRAIQADGGRVPTRKEVLDAVASTHLLGATGLFTFLPTGDPTSPVASVYRVEKGHWVFWQNAPSSP